MMESSSRKSPSIFSSKLSHLSVGLSYPTSNLIPNRKFFGGSGVGTLTESYTEMSPEEDRLLRMDKTSIFPMVPQKENNILQKMAYALSPLINFVSKIPNYISSPNNTLSVTVVPNEGIISSEYLLRNLTRSKKNMKTRIESLAGIFESVKKSTLHGVLQSVETELFREQKMSNSLQKNLVELCTPLPVTRVNDGHIADVNVQPNNIPSSKSDLNMVTNGDIQHVKYMKTSTSQISIPLTRNNTSEYLKKDMRTGIIEATKMDNHEMNVNEKTEFNRCTGLEMPIEKPLLPKIWRKFNMIARHRGKSRGKLQLRKSGVSQSKHRKERLKQNLHDVQNELHAHGEVRHDCWRDDDDNDCDSASPVEIRTIPQFKRVPVEYQNTKSRHHLTVIQKCSSPNNYISPKCKFRSRHSSGKSIDSDDSDHIIFRNDSEPESEDYDDGSIWSEESDQSDVQSNRKVRLNLEPTVHVMIQWDYAYRAARKGPWEEVARDRARFRSRINSVGEILQPILSLQHRERIYKNRINSSNSSFGMDSN